MQNFKIFFFYIPKSQKKSCIRETKHLSTDADSSTDAIGGWTKNTHYAKPLEYLDWDKADKI